MFPALGKSQTTQHAIMNLITLSSSQIQDTMARLSYFEGWSKDQLIRLSSGAKQLSLTKKEPLASKGEHIQSMYVVISGQIRLFIPLSNGAERVISLVGQGESFGEPCPYDAIAGKDSYVLAIDGMVYRRELRQSPLLAERTLKLISQRLLHTLRDIEICAQPSSLQRVAHYMMHLQPQSPATELEFRLPALKRDIAAKLGLSQETFSRMLAFLAQQGFIQFSGNQVRVDDWTRLQKLASAGCPMEVPGKN